jgi:outer membrane protein assembly factor BamB
MNYKNKLFLFAFLSLTSTLIVSGKGSLIWEFSSRGGIYSSPTVDESTLYIGSNDSCLYAIGKKNGTLKWKFKTGGEIKSKPLAYKNAVIFNSSDGKVYAINKTNGQKQWAFATNGEKRLDMWDYYLSSPVYSDGKVFVGSGDGNIYALDPAKGTLVWKFKTEGIVHATPLVYNGKLFIGSFDGFFYALNAVSGDLIWKFKTVGDAYFPKGEIQKGAVAYKNSVIFGSRDFNIYALNAETGRGLWNMKEKGSWVIATPLIYNDVAYFGTSDSHRFCGLSATTGYEQCSFPLNMRVYGEAVTFENNIYFGCFNGKLYRLDPSHNKLESVFQTYGSRSNYSQVYNEKDEFKSGFELYGNDQKGAEAKILRLGSILSTPVIEEGIIYFGDSNGVFYAYRLNND